MLMTEKNGTCKIFHVEVGAFGKFYA